MNYCRITPSILKEVSLLTFDRPQVSQFLRIEMEISSRAIMYPGLLLTLFYLTLAFHVASDMESPLFQSVNLFVFTLTNAMRKPTLIIMEYLSLCSSLI